MEIDCPTRVRVRVKDITTQEKIPALLYLFRWERICSIVIRRVIPESKEKICIFTLFPSRI